jgi:ornithine cyclodeaminase/alanine dehydrogenase-like protein (mu-crystallin family)
MLVLSHSDVAATLTLPDCIRIIEQALIGLARGQYFQPLRQRFRHESAAGRLVLLPAARLNPDPLWGLKEIVVTPSNGARGIDPHQGAVLLHDGSDGQLLAVVHAGAITSIRTAAASAVATRALARKGASNVLIAGAGVQARAHVAALRCILPQARIAIWGRSAVKAQTLARECECDAVAALADAVSNADVICTTTTATEPIIRREWLRAGCHINAVGSSIPTSRELDGATLAAGSLFVDRAESTRNESGDFLLAVREGAIGADHIRAELGDVLAGTAPGRCGEDEITIFKSLGFGTQDLAAAEFAYRQALARGLGTRAAWE